ncbi:uncharacterized protein N7515_009405 [Penicillium bovifimosum]|uniref:Uncharacterized protein n=1 Tax=Penicillium bovifimosum TaxID=126998 RepID=A0A9W9GJG7_9EURO|nr:uncharacterized protein N7515_009405 [Penicillium bovifimosum]KAJ5121444.1 hypothetical protein N7515_009405 [Penicillium bovifimosum]
MDKTSSWMDMVNWPSSPEKTGDASNLALGHNHTESSSVYAPPPSDIRRVSDQRDADIPEDGLELICPEVLGSQGFDQPEADMLEDGLDAIWPEVFGAQPFDQPDADILEGGIEAVWPEVGWDVLPGELPDDELFPGVSIESSDNGGNSGGMATQDDGVIENASQCGEGESKEGDVEQDEMNTMQDQNRNISDEGESGKDKENDAAGDSNVTLPWPTPVAEGLAEVSSGPVPIWDPMLPPPRRLRFLPRAEEASIVMNRIHDGNISAERERARDRANNAPDDSDTTRPWLTPAAEGLAEVSSGCVPTSWDPMLPPPRRRRLLPDSTSPTISPARRRGACIQAPLQPNRPDNQTLIVRWTFRGQLIRQCEVPRELTVHHHLLESGR